MPLHGKVYPSPYFFHSKALKELDYTTIELQKIQSTLLEIASRVPKSMTELLSIKGLGKAKCRKYGEEILKITSEF